MHPVEEMMERIKKIRAGERVLCKKCKRGIMEPVGEHEKANCFVCNKCGQKLNMN